LVRMLSPTLPCCAVLSVRVPFSLKLLVEFPLSFSPLHEQVLANLFFWERDPPRSGLDF